MFFFKYKNKSTIFIHQTNETFICIALAKHKLSFHYRGIKKTTSKTIKIMTTFINNNIDSSLSNLNMSYHANISEMKDFTVKHVGNDQYKLVTLSYNGWDEPVENELTPLSLIHI